MTTKKLTRKEKRAQASGRPHSNNGLNLESFIPLTANQELTFARFNEGKHLFLHGMAGTGKTFISLYLSLREILQRGTYNKIILVRSVVPSRDMGFLPGSVKDKVRVFESPYYDICSELFSRGDAYELLKTKDIINFTTTSFIRGTTFNDAIIVVDEAQNMLFSEADTIITRVGKNCKIIFCGDIRQTDFQKETERSGLRDFMRIIRKIGDFGFVEFTEEDIVRSDLVKRYLIAKADLNL